MNKSIKKLISFTLAGTLALSVTFIPANADAAKKAKLANKKVTVKVGKKATIKIKNKNKKAKYAFSSSKKAVATVSKSGVVKGVKKGSTTITVKETKNKKKKIVGKVKVVVTAKETENNADENTTVAPTVTETPAVTTAPETTATPAPPEKTPIPKADLKAYPADNDFSCPEKGKINMKYTIRQGQIDKISYDSTAVAEGKTIKRNAQVFLPKDYAPESKKYPVFYMFHGFNGDHTSMQADGSQNVLWNAIWLGDAVDCIMVCPNLCANEKASQEVAAYDNFINDFEKCLMPYIESHYAVKTGRENVAVGGFSMGGREALAIGIKLQDKIAYISGYCAAPGVLPYENFGSQGSEKGQLKPEEMTIKDEYKDKTVILIVKGGSDALVDHWPKTYAETLEKNGNKVLYYENPGTGHGPDTYQVGIYNMLKRAFRNPKINTDAK